MKILVGLNLLLTLVALIFSIAAYNRSGGYLENQLKSVTAQADQAKAEANTTLALSKAQTELNATRAKFILDNNYQQAQKSVAAIRKDLASAFNNSTSDMQTLWQSADQALETLEQNLLQESPDSLEVFQKVIDVFKVTPQSS